MKYVGSHRELESTLYVTTRASCVDAAMTVVAVAKERRLLRWSVERRAVPGPKKRSCDVARAEAAEIREDTPEAKRAAAGRNFWAPAKVPLDPTKIDDAEVERGASTGA